jgi:hypothetical protein
MTMGGPTAVRYEAHLPLDLSIQADSASLELPIVVSDSRSGEVLLRDLMVGGVDFRAALEPGERELLFEIAVRRFADAEESAAIAVSFEQNGAVLETYLLGSGPDDPEVVTHTFLASSDEKAVSVRLPKAVLAELSAAIASAAQGEDVVSLTLGERVAKQLLVSVAVGLDVASG